MWVIFGAIQDNVNSHHQPWRSSPFLPGDADICVGGLHKDRKSKYNCIIICNSSWLWENKNVFRCRYDKGKVNCGISGFEHLVETGARKMEEKVTKIDGGNRPAVQLNIKTFKAGYYLLAYSWPQQSKGTLCELALVHAYMEKYWRNVFRSMFHHKQTKWSPQRIATLLWCRVLGAPVTLGDVLSGALALAGFSKAKGVPGEGPD